jgi:hypothetical protein
VAKLSLRLIKQDTRNALNGSIIPSKVLQTEGEPMACLGVILQRDNAACAEKQIPAFRVVQSVAFASAQMYLNNRDIKFLTLTLRIISGTSLDAGC